MIAELLKSKRIILASASPRRDQLLKELGLPYQVRKFSFKETVPKTGSAEEIVRYLAKSKADEIRDTVEPGDIFITADTIVWCDGRLMNKPADRSEAQDMLRFLSGKTHSVLTGVCLLSDISEVSFSSETLVTFKVLSEEEISYYIDKYKPFDKAGGYGIQEWIGYIGVERIEGSYFNVMGLPIQRLYSELRDFINIK